MRNKHSVFFQLNYFFTQQVKIASKRGKIEVVRDRISQYFCIERNHKPFIYKILNYEKITV